MVTFQISSSFIGMANDVGKAMKHRFRFCILSIFTGGAAYTWP